MPTYDYLCKFCEHALEVFQNLSDKKLRKCPECGRAGLQRLIGSGGGIVFKGSGFYETDYRSSGYKADQKKDSGSSGSGGDAPKTSGSDGASGSGSGAGSGSGSGTDSAAGKGKTGAGGKTAPKPGGGSADKGKS